MGVLDEPFPGSWALAAGVVTRWELRHDFSRVFPDVYVRRGVVLDAGGRARAAAHWAKGAGVVMGCSAAALHGTRWVDPECPAELAHPRNSKPPCGIQVTQADIDAYECCDVEGFRVTTPARTAFDIGRRLPRDRALPMLDALCAATGIQARDIAVVAQANPGVRGIRRLMELIPLVDAGAESPPESLTRLLLVDHGLPCPTTQLVVRDPYGTFVARLDMGWERWRVGVEYDGVQHWTDPTQRARDVDRLANLESLGWRIIRVDAALLHRRPHILADRVHAAIRARGI